MSATDFISRLPKVELHVHIEGTLTPELRWKLAQRNKIILPYNSLSSLVDSYNVMYNHRPQLNVNNESMKLFITFLEAYYGGMEVLRMEVLRTEEDFYELGMAYFKKAREMNVRYAEPFFDIQAHTRRGVRVEVVMKGLKRAKEEAARSLKVHANWTLCFLRDMSLDLALEAYDSVLPFRDTFNAIGLDSDEYENPPSKFEPLFLRARKDGFKITCHCDVGQKNTHEHIRQVISCVAGTGADRLDHGLNAAEKPELFEAIKVRGLGMTLCPHAYHRRTPAQEVFPKIRSLFEHGIKVTINSDDPTYMHNQWVIENLRLVQKMCSFDNAEMVVLQRNAVEISWADQDLKDAMLEELKSIS